MNDDIANTPGWYWKQTHWDNYRLIAPDGNPRDFRSYADLCWFCGRHGINAVQS